ncbi:MAG TPA: YceI family protein [Tepidisphaeraceae bacterium]|nr:YceI family protein [Tepidisphaeraceae bacterium]
MRSIRFAAFAFVAMFAFTMSVRAAETYTGDPVHSSLVFKSSHLNVSHVYGRFNAPTSTLTVENGELTAVEASVAAKNVDTGVEKRDNHLRSADFFNAAEFPQITFKSTAVKKTGDGKYDVTGDLTLHGVTKSITVTVTKTGEGDNPPPFGHRAGWESTFSVKRSEFGMTKMIPMVGDEVEVTIAIEAHK